MTLRERTIDLREQEVLTLAADALTADEAEAIAADRFARVAVDWPSRGTDGKWKLRPAGWIGSLPVAPGLLLRIAPKLPVRRVFELLDRANDSNIFQTFPGIIYTNDAEGVREVLVSLLEGAVSARLARGLHRGYREQPYVGQAPRGRVLPVPTLMLFASGRPRFQCITTPITEDIEDNRILAWTLDRVSSLPLSDPGVLGRVKTLARSLCSSISLIPIDAETCRGRIYGRTNADYVRLHALCAMLLDGIGPDQGPGDQPFAPFGIWMPALFEQAVVRWLAATRPLGLFVSTPHTVVLGGDPQVRFVLDALLTWASGSPAAVVEVKYKDSVELEADDVQQAIAYATAVGAAVAFLVYPAKTRVRPPLRAGNVSLWPVHLDLQRPFGEAASKLHSVIVEALRRVLPALPLTSSSGRPQLKGGGSAVL
jgi:5-methylcytosine-specific restriction enzyme subunit McrC